MLQLWLQLLVQLWLQLVVAQLFCLVLSSWVQVVFEVAEQLDWSEIGIIQVKYILQLHI